MLNNDTLRRLRYAMEFNNSQMLEILKSMDLHISEEQLNSYLTKEDEEGFVPCPNEVLESFLDGLILKNRGPRDPSKKAPPQEMMSNNLILKKLRIALNYKEEDMLSVFDEVGFTVSRSEFNALFRKKGHRNYVECGDQILRNFLLGLAKKLRPKD